MCLQFYVYTCPRKKLVGPFQKADFNFGRNSLKPSLFTLLSVVQRYPFQIVHHSICFFAKYQQPIASLLIIDNLRSYC